MKVLILEDVIQHQVRLERTLDEISKELNIPISYKTTTKNKSSYLVTKGSPVTEDMVTDKKV